jgi:hypothetical protein
MGAFSLGISAKLVMRFVMMGGALGLAVLASVAASRTSHLLTSGHSRIGALDAGYHTAFVIGALFAVLAAGFAAGMLRTRPTMSAGALASAHRSEAALAEAGM